LYIDFQTIELRPAESDDDPFLFEVYTSSRGEDLAEMGLEAGAIRTFLETQYAAHQVFFQNDYPETDDSIIMRESERIGRMVVLRGEREIQLVDIALLTTYRNAGIGAYLVKQLLAEAERLDKVFRVQVMRISPAVALFERLGLVRIGETGSHYQMEWRAG
jgi:ribosomal protein S18 acetylase RimI-like enzyme